MIGQERSFSDGASPYDTYEKRAEAPHPTVLIVEDEHVARRALAALLAARGFQPRAAASAEEALRLLLRNGDAPRVALVDLNLPGMNGVDFIERLERMNPGVFPVLMTAAGEDELAAAVDDRPLVCLRKPLDLRRLMSVVGDGEHH